MTPNTVEPAAEPQPAARPAPGLWHDVRRVLKPVASLQLTVVLFALAIGLVFFGTLAQKSNGLWTVVDRYFWSWVVWVPFDLLADFAKTFFDLSPTTRWDGSFPFPAGKLLGGAMLVNLLAAHLVRFKVSWKRSGIVLIHSGMILLFVGEFITREHAVEQRMIIPEGATINYTQDARMPELAFVDRSDPVEDRVTVIPEWQLKQTDTRITHPDLPADVKVTEFFPNSDVEEGERGLRVVGRPEVTGTDPDQKVDTAGAYVRLYKKGTDEVIGTYPVQVGLDLVPVALDGKPYRFGLRFKRYYKPYAVKLVKFRADKYVGTNTPKNYSSEVVLTDPERGVERERESRMNEPLRHRGETLYQGSFMGTTTVLQVVKNPGWMIPYVSCVVVTLGLLVHFGIYLTQFLLRRAAQ